MDVKQADPKTLPACVVQPRRLNRYLDILPNPGTRVVLAKPDASDPRWRELASLCDDFPGMSAEQRELVMRYYNANYVRGYAYVCAPAVPSRAVLLAPLDPWSSCVVPLCLRPFSQLVAASRLCTRINSSRDNLYCGFNGPPSVPGAVATPGLGMMQRARDPGSILRQRARHRPPRTTS